MKIIIAPAKKMKNDIAYLSAKQQPMFLKEAKKITNFMKTQSKQQLKKMLQCSDRIAEEAFNMYQNMCVDDADTPALLAFEGIQYTYMAPHLFEDEWYDYVENHLCILSGVYGLLKPFDAVVPYRLEINTSFHTPFCNSLYEFWGERIYNELCKDNAVILDLASAQHARTVKKYVKESTRYVKCYFMEKEKDKLNEKGVYVKMARGSMVRWMAEEHIEDIDDVKHFQELGYQFKEKLSDSNTFVFVREKRKANKK